MGIYKQCKCTDPDKCSHPWWGQSRGKRVPLAKWGKKPVKTRTDAKKVFALLEAAVLDGSFHRGPSKEGYVIEDLVKDYLEHYFIPNGRVLEKEHYRFEAIKKRFGGIKPEDLSLLDVEKWVNARRAQKKSPSTIRKDVARLRAIMNWGWGRNLFQAMKVRWRGLELAPAGDGRARRLEEGEEARLKTHANPWLQNLITAALDTGLRANALLNLTFGMVQGNELVVPRRLLKNKHATHDLRVPLTGRLKKIIIFLRQGPHNTQYPDDRAIFGWQWGRKRRDFRTAWENCRLKAAGLEPRKDRAGRVWNREQIQKIDLHWHDLRGEFATRLHEAGVGIETISYLLDHSTIEMTRRYLKIRTRSTKPAEAIAALEQFHAAFAATETIDEVGGVEVTH